MIVVLGGGGGLWSCKLDQNLTRTIEDLLSIILKLFSNVYDKNYLVLNIKVREIGDNEL